MFLILITAAILTVLYALAWHDQPGREPVIVRNANRRQESHE